MATRGRKFHRGHRKMRGKKLNKRQVREVKKILGKQVELKQFPGYTTGTASTSGTMVKLSSLTQGNTGTTFVGDEVNLKKFTIRCAMEGNDQYNTMRFIVFRFRDDDASAAPLLSEIIDTSGGAAYNVMAPYNHQFREKYHIMADFNLITTNTYSFNSTGTVQAATSSFANMYHLTRRHTVFGKKLGAKKINFTNVASSYGFNHVYCLVVTDSSPLTQHPTYWLSTECWFTDA